ncbi:MAG: excinuclease ABC subunit B [Flavobacterium sp. BFFFF1]|uniref:excinuclease ABC subunit B n=1 Tax=Flavobacterium sp. BFFFF1 TaxID=2015557 RepID=UPI000BC470D8|nr:excinuclease ABC subunit B [Flavobacterium sp. BFFFF1]OYU79392.1 MAG: excinuclease ABC subunit B [Flavobacterium sp. BFFFF1]
MNNYEQKISLLTDMIAFSIVDGKLHQREYEFLLLIANELKIEKAIFDDLFHQELPVMTIKMEIHRIHQFYRLALLMHVDGIMHEKEEIAIKQMAINMGLNPAATKKVLRMIKDSPRRVIDPKQLMDAFKEQYN